MPTSFRSPARAQALDAFSRHFDGPPAAVVRSPGRVNLIGEHTDYNDGFVLPLAIERATWCGLRPRIDRRVRIYSCDFQQAAEFSVDDLARGAPEWCEYARGVAEQLLREPVVLRGFDAAIATDVPVGAGLSSSASFSLAITRAFCVASGFAWNAVAMARLCQRVEQQRIGVNCGIMDQLVIAAAEEGQALLIDCRSFATRPAPLPPGHVVIILDTKKSRTLAGSAYNQRRAECESAAKFFGVPSLRDVSLADLGAALPRLDPVVGRRARHVVSENDRVQQAFLALQSGDARKLGDLMNASHESLRTDYEVSCPELDGICSLARAHPGCLGARMTGAGFGGCAVALVAAELVEPLMAGVCDGFRQKFGVVPALYPTQAAAGVSDSRLELPSS